jgi:hypothetical protein
MGAYGCPACGKTVDRVDVACRHCGATLPPRSASPATSNRKMWTIGCLVVPAIVVLAIIGAMVSDEPGGSSSTRAGGRAIEYRVQGMATRVSVTYQNAQGGTSQEADVSVPWSITFECRRGAFLYISAQNQTESGSVRVQILKNDAVFNESESSGGYTIAQANGEC